MDDFFALLGLPRRPAIDPGALKAGFRKLAAAHHPDVAQMNRADSIDFGLLNQAHTALASPASRLRHLAALEFPGADGVASAEIPAALADLWFDIGTFTRELDALIAQRKQASSALARAQLAPREVELHERAQPLLARLNAAESRCIAALDSLDRDWGDPASRSARALLELAGHFTCLSRWKSQLDERLVQLTL